MTFWAPKNAEVGSTNRIFPTENEGIRPNGGPFLKGNESSSNHQFSGDLLVFRGVWFGIGMSKHDSSFCFFFYSCKPSIGSNVQ